uniref:hypothetical protein n=1 Tax=Rickettsiella massiliensis TaxID=676517 RepID=UPI00029ADABB
LEKEHRECKDKITKEEERCRKEREQLEKEKKGLEDQLTKLEKEHRECKDNVSDDPDLETLKVKYKYLKEEKDDLYTKFKLCENEKNHLANELSEANGRITDLEVECDHLKDKLRKLKRSNA